MSLHSYNQAVTAVRKQANATNLVLFAGQNWNFDLHQLLQNFPTDPLENCAVSWHPYEAASSKNEIWPFRALRLQCSLAAVRCVKAFQNFRVRKD